MTSIRDTEPLTTLLHHPHDLLSHLQTSQRPVTLTVEGLPVAIIQHPTEYQRLLNLAAFASAEEGIRQGREDMRAGRVIDAETVFEQLRVELGIPG